MISLKPQSVEKQLNGIDGERRRLPHSSAPESLTHDDTSFPTKIRALPKNMNHNMYLYMNESTPKRRVTANIPTQLLQEACDVSGSGITDTLIQGLTMVARSKAAAKAACLKGKLNLEIDLEASRERSRR